MKLDNQQLMEEFYSSVKEDFPNIDFEQLKDICFGPWRFLKQEMESGQLPTIRFKYFGTFTVYEGRARNMIYNLDKKFEQGKIEERQYLKYKEMIGNYLKRIDNEKKTE